MRWKICLLDIEGGRRSPWFHTIQVDGNFKGCLQPEEFLDWIVVVEEILEFKEVPQDKRDYLVATKFKGCATSWWQQLKQGLICQGKSKINT